MAKPEDQARALDAILAQSEQPPRSARQKQQAAKNKLIPYGVGLYPDQWAFLDAKAEELNTSRNRLLRYLVELAQVGKIQFETEEVTVTRLKAG